MSSQDQRSVEPLWISRNVLDAIHSDQVEQYGGSQGVRDHGLIESALARPLNLVACAKPDFAEPAAAYGVGITKNHPFVDGKQQPLGRGAAA